jgi:hypothetical protein
MTIKVNDNDPEVNTYNERYLWNSSTNDIRVSGSADGSHKFIGEFDDLQIWKTSQPEIIIVPFVITNYTLTTNTDTFVLTGTANSDSPITSIQYRKYVESQADDAGWENCACADNNCDSITENFTCTIPDLDLQQTYTYELRSGTGEPVTYIGADKYKKFDITRMDSNEMVAWWSFDDTTTITDRSGNELNGTAVGTITTGTSDLGSNTNVFAENGCFEIPDENGLLDFSGITSEFTVDALIKPSVDLADNTRYVVIQKSANNDDLIWEFGIIGGSNVLWTTVHTSEGNKGFDTTQTLNIGEWNRVKIAFSNLDQTYTVKINDSTPESFSWYKAFDMPQSSGDLTIGSSRNCSYKFLGEIDDIKIYNTADARAPQVSIEPLATPERVTNANQPFDISVTDETGIKDFEFLFYNGPFGDNLDTENWVQVENPTTGAWGDKSIRIEITAPNLGDGEWYLYMRSTDTNGFKHTYENSGWYSYDPRVSPSAMPYYRFVMETEDILLH